MRRKNVKLDYRLHVENFDLKNINFRQKEIVDNFCREEIDSSCGMKITRIVDPVQVLLNQERLNSILGNTAAKHFIDSFRNQKVDPFGELKKQCSDDDLKTMIKSRHLQAPAEILAWAKYMQDNAELFTSEVQKLLASKQAESELKQTDKTNEL